MQNMGAAHAFEQNIYQQFARSQEYLLRNGVTEDSVKEEYKDLQATVKAIVRTAYMTGNSDGLQLAIKTAMEGKSYGGRK